MQNRKRDTDVQNRLLDSVGEGEGRMFRENSMYIATFQVEILTIFRKGSRVASMFSHIKTTIQTLAVEKLLQLCSLNTF